MARKDMVAQGKPAATPEIAAEIAKQLPEGTDAAQVQVILEAWNTVLEGDPVGTVKRDETTGALAHRVELRGVPTWFVSNPDGSRYQDASNPSLPWTVLWSPE